MGQQKNAHYDIPWAEVCCYKAYSLVHTLPLYASMKSSKLANCLRNRMKRPCHSNPWAEVLQLTSPLVPKQFLFKPA